MSTEAAPWTHKISSTFAMRLRQLGSRQQVRAVVMLRTVAHEGADGRAATRANRRKAIEALRKSAAPALSAVDAILERFDGRRLAADVDALGCIPIETTPEGIRALAASDHVRTIFEDQPISLLHTV